jgi:hypothetical protein
MRRLIDLLQDATNSSVERLTNRRTVLKNHIEQQEKDCEQRLESDTSAFIRRGKDRLEVLESAIEAQLACDQLATKKQTDLIARLRRDKQTLADTAVKATESAEAKFAKEMKDLRRSYDTRMQNRKAELAAAGERRKAEREKRIAAIQANFQQDLHTPPTEAKMDETINFDKEAAEHQIERTKTLAKLEFAEKQIAGMREGHAKKLASLAIEMSRIEKAKRQLERRRKTETQQLDEDFEMRIQVEQVQVRNLMENIAKLYDKDENQRGCEIIEAIRKVKETHNHTNDFLTRKGRELDSLRKGAQKVCGELQLIVQQIEEMSAEKDLSAQIDQANAGLAASVAEIAGRTDARLARVNQEIEQQRLKTGAEIQGLQDRIEAETAEFHATLRTLAEEKTTIEESTKQEMAHVEAEFQKQTEQTNREHEAAVERMIRRIEAARGARDELVKKFKTEKEAEARRDRADFEQRNSENAQGNAKMFAQARAKSEELSNRISELSKRSDDAELRMFSPTARTSDQKRIESLCSRLLSLDDIIEATFEQFFMALKEGAANPRYVETPAPMSSQGGRNPNNSTSRGSRRDSTRVVTPVESKIRKKTQFLITPQYV